MSSIEIKKIGGFILASPLIILLLVTIITVNIILLPFIALEYLVDGKWQWRGFEGD